MDDIIFKHRSRQITVKRGPDYVAVSSQVQNPHRGQWAQPDWILERDGMLDSYSADEARRFGEALIAAADAKPGYG